MIKCRWLPGCLIVTFCTVGRKLLRNVIRVCCLCEIVVVATVTGIGCIVVITIVAGSTVVGDSRMSPEQLIEIIVYGECSRRPARICSVTRFTGNRQIERNVIRIDTLVVVGLVTCCAGIGCIVVIALMTVIAGGGQVCAREWPVAVTECGWYPGILSVALFTAQRELLCLVIRIGGIVVIIRMTTGTGIGCIVVVAVMTCCTVVGNSRVRSGQLIEVVVYRECGRRPARIGSVAGFTGGRQIERRVVRIDALVVVCSMAACTGIGPVRLFRFVSSKLLRAFAWMLALVFGFPEQRLGFCDCVEQGSDAGTDGTEVFLFDAIRHGVIPMLACFQPRVFKSGQSVIQSGSGTCHIQSFHARGS